MFYSLQNQQVGLFIHLQSRYVVDRSQFHHNSDKQLFPQTPPPIKLNQETVNLHPDVVSDNLKGQR